MQNNRIALKRFLPMLVVAVVLAAIVAGMLLRRNALKEDAASQAAGAAEPLPTPSTDAGSADASNQQIVRRAVDKMPAGLSREQRATYVRERRENMFKAGKERNEAFLKAAKTKFQSEKVDQVWSSQAETRLESIVSPQQLAAYDVSVQDMKVECKSTSCRINSTFNSSREADDWLVLYMSNVGENLPQSFVKTDTLADGRVQIEIYGSARR